jgi:hypothetical protein
MLSTDKLDVGRAIGSLDSVDSVATGYGVDE